MAIITAIIMAIIMVIIMAIIMAIIITTTTTTNITLYLTRLTLLGQFKSGRTWPLWTTARTNTLATSASPSDMFHPRANLQVQFLNTQKLQK